MKSYTITLTGKNSKFPVYKDTVMAESKNEAWLQIKGNVIAAMWKIDYTGEIEIKEG